MGVMAAHTGDELVEFFPGRDPFLLPDQPDLPIVFSCAIVRHRGRALYVFNAWRKGWELPAGMIEPDESPYDAAARELREESGQVAAGLTFAGMCLIRLKGSRLELGTVYTGTIQRLRPIRTDAEISQVMLWDGVQMVQGYIDDISQELCKCVNGTG